MTTRIGSVALVIVLASASPALSQMSQNTPPPPPPPDPTHDITQVDPAPEGGAIAVPLPEKQRRKFRKYEIPEMVGARQAIGSQLIDGRLPDPILDYWSITSKVQQRISFFEGGLVVVRMAGAGGTIQKRVIIPEDAMERYRKVASPKTLREVREEELAPPSEGRFSLLRIYEADGKYVERQYDPAAVRSKTLHDQINPLEDLLRTISEDRTVTSTLANYEPQVGDELMGDDRKVWRVERIIKDTGIVQLRCESQPTLIYVAKKDLYNYFVGRAN